MNTKTLLAVAALLTLTLSAPVSEAGGLFRKKKDAEQTEDTSQKDAKAAQDEARWEVDFIKKNIIQGKTTKEQVRAIWDQPADISYAGDGIEYWSYNRSSSGGRGLVGRLSRAGDAFSRITGRGTVAGGAAKQTEQSMKGTDTMQDLGRQTSGKTRKINNISLTFNEKGIVTELYFSE